MQYRCLSEQRRLTSQDDHESPGLWLLSKVSHMPNGYDIPPTGHIFAPQRSSARSLI